MARKNNLATAATESVDSLEDSVQIMLIPIAAVSLSIVLGLISVVFGSGYSISFDFAQTTDLGGLLTFSNAGVLAAAIPAIIYGVGEVAEMVKNRQVFDTEEGVAFAFAFALPLAVENITVVSDLATRSVLSAGTFLVLYVGALRYLQTESGN